MKSGIISLCLSFAALSVFAGSGLELFSDRPANHWDSDRYPLGNGRIGAMGNGGVTNLNVQVNLDSLWTGDANLNGSASDSVADSNYKTMGEYRNLGEFSIRVDGDAEPVEGYRRVLDLSRAVETVKYRRGGADGDYSAFVSSPDRVLVCRVNFGKAVSGELRLNGVNGERTKYERGNGYSDAEFSGGFPNRLKYAARLRLVALTGDTVAEDGGIKFSGCTGLLALFTADSNYDSGKPDFINLDWNGDVRSCLSAAQSKGYDRLLADHQKAYSRYFGRLQLRLDNTDPALEKLTTAERVARCRQGQRDPDLARLLFQYGRYLLICSSWPGSLPANLQGIWNNSNHPAWHCDYHTNINIQMNYWGAETTNLSEMHLPLFDWMKALAPLAETETKKAFPGSQGFAYRTSANIFGGMGWRWNLPGAAWTAHHAYEHYAFTLDEDFLKQTGYPLLKGAALFCLTHIKERPDGTIVVPNGWSPEHGPREDGVAHDQQIYSQIFADILACQPVVKDSAKFVEEVRRVKGKLLGNKIGKWGQLQEWETDRDVKGDAHRHTSHLFAVYPGDEITLNKTPEFAKAAAVALEGRALTGDARRSWTWPWRAAMWARLGNGEKAGQMVESLLQYNTMPNLFTTHPPFQIDGNLGIVGAVAESLVQSHEGFVNILPVVMPGWENGQVSGLRARGGITVDFSWKNGKVTDYQLHGTAKKVRVKVNGAMADASVKN